MKSSPFTRCQLSPHGEVRQLRGRAGPHGPLQMPFRCHAPPIPQPGDCLCPTRSCGCSGRFSLFPELRIYIRQIVHQWGLKRARTREGISNPADPDAHHGDAEVQGGHTSPGPSLPPQLGHLSPLS